MPWLVVLLLFFVAIGYLALKTMKKTANVRAADLRDQMAGDSRALYVPIRRLAQEIDHIVVKSKSSPEMRILALEAQNEASQISNQIGQLLVARGQIRRAIADQGTSDLKRAELELNLEQAASLAERQALQSALDASRLEASQLVGLDDQIAQIDAFVRQAEAALSELRTRLNVALASQAMGQGGDDSLRDTIGRLKSLSSSVEETEKFLNS
ncbi:MAG: hypothetical protein ACOYON_16240 [Fimbriimonas sp.]